MAKRILLTNDDGIDAPGMAALRSAVTGLAGVEVLVVAPLGERSGTGCGLSIVKEMSVEERRDPQSGALWGYALDGFPADCVKFAVTALDGYRPDLVLSGINRGYNVGNSIFYSGTVACAIEATFFGLRAMATSVGYRKGEPIDYAPAAARVRSLVPWLLEQSWTPRTFWNFNLPPIPESELKETRHARQGTSFYRDDFRLSREENGRRFYRNVGEILMQSPETDDCDDRLLYRGHPTLTLISIDMTVPMPAAARQSLEFEWKRRGENR